MKAFNETIYTSEDLIATNVDSKDIKASGKVTADQFFGDGSGLTTVSYTHLTLPTILLL